MVESFVKTFKRDYVHVRDRPDAVTVRGHPEIRFEDCHDDHPHNSFKMQPSREFIRAQMAVACAI
jgi:putative transposase